MKFEIKKSGSYDVPEIKERVSWPWKDMGVGDMVEIPESVAHRAQVGCHVYGSNAGKKFKTRKQPDGTLAVWRIE